MKIVMTGATGYVGRCFVDRVRSTTDWEIVSLQRNMTSTPFPSSREATFTTIKWDFRMPFHMGYPDVYGADVFLHLGADVHALRSLEEPLEFVRTNVLGTCNFLDLARMAKPKLFMYMSTAEVLGGRDEGYSKEDDLLLPSNPYAASKGAGELLVQSYVESFGLSAIIIRTMNLYGPTQTDTTKFVPMVTKKLLAGEEIQIHTKNGRPGMRQWITGEDFAVRLIAIIKDRAWRIYHVVGEEVSNLEMAQRVADRLKVTMKYRLVEQPKTHCWRYALQTTRPVGIA